MNRLSILPSKGSEISHMKWRAVLPRVRTQRILSGAFGSANCGGRKRGSFNPGAATSVRNFVIYLRFRRADNFFKQGTNRNLPTRTNPPTFSSGQPVRFLCAMIFLVPHRSSLHMTARILDGLKIRDQIFAELKGEIAAMTAAGIRPGLAAVLVGDNPASQLYVKSKIAACEQLGIASWMHTPPSTVSTREMLQLVDDLNGDPAVDGILIQLPLPPQVDTKLILESIDPAKDVDGFHPMNLGRLVSGRPGLVACTPAGCMEILKRGNIPIEGADAVVLGRSDIVGKPMSLLLMHANATVTICHSKTRDLPGTVRRADIIVAAMGKAGYVAADWIKPGAAVIDVGTNRVTDPAEAERLVGNFPARLAKFREKGSVLGGDGHPDGGNVAGALTPVPGGVGPMTITMLMSNTVKAGRLRRGKKLGGGAANSQSASSGAR